MILKFLDWLYELINIIQIINYQNNIRWLIIEIIIR